MRQLVLHLASEPNPTHAPVCILSLLLAQFEMKPVVSKQQKTIPVFLCGRCPVPAPAGSAVDLWQPGKTDSKTPRHPSRKVDRPARFVSAEEDSPPPPGGFIYYICVFRFQLILYEIQRSVSIVFCRFFAKSIS